MKNSEEKRKMVKKSEEKINGSEEIEKSDKSEKNKKVNKVK